MSLCAFSVFVHFECFCASLHSIRTRIELHLSLYGYHVLSIRLVYSALNYLCAIFLSSVGSLFD